MVYISDCIEKKGIIIDIIFLLKKNLIIFVN